MQFPIYYETHGNPSHPCIILITGLGGQLIQWSDLFIEGLVNKNLYVVTFDNRDSGLSKYYDHLGSPDFQQAMKEKAEGRFKPPYTFGDMADDVLMLMDKLSIQKTHILGTSMSGMIAQTLAIRCPQRLLSLILIATSSGDSHLPGATKEVLDFYASSLSESNTDSLESYLRKARLYKIYDPCFFKEETTRVLFEKLYKRTASPDGVKRQLMAFLSEQPRGDKLKKVTANSLIIHGAVDPAFPPEHGKYLHAVLQNSRLEIIEKMGHLIPSELCVSISRLIADFTNDN